MMADIFAVCILDSRTSGETMIQTTDLNRILSSYPTKGSNNSHVVMLCYILLWVVVVLVVWRWGCVGGGGVMAVVVVVGRR